jgi:ribosome maturation factor RimP
METNSSVTVSKNSKDSTTSLENRIEELTKTAGLDLVEFKKFQVGTSQTIRITINDPCKPVGHDQCFLLSKLIHESEPELKEKYNLEVWSPGIGRELKSPL